MAGDKSIYSVSNTGDMNSDGYSDIIIGSVWASPNSQYLAGTSYVIFGRSSTNSYSDIDLSSNTFTSNGIEFKVNC